METCHAPVVSAVLFVVYALVYGLFPWYREVTVGAGPAGWTAVRAAFVALAAGGYAALVMDYGVRAGAYAEHHAERLHIAHLASGYLLASFGPLVVLTVEGARRKGWRWVRAPWCPFVLGLWPVRCTGRASQGRAT
jgi:hypothetical protein